MRQVKIIFDENHPWNTKIIDVATNERITNVFAVHLTIKANNKVDCILDKYTTDKNNNPIPLIQRKGENLLFEHEDEAVEVIQVEMNFNKSPVLINIDLESVS